MKINKKKPSHWYCLLKQGIFSLALLPFRPILKNNNAAEKTIILYGHKLHGNLLSIYWYLQNHPDLNYHCYFFTLDKNYYQTFPDHSHILGLTFKDIAKVVGADCIISDHGLHAFEILLYGTNIKFIDVWHGIPFKGFIPDNFKTQHRYHETWVSSEKLKSVYIDRFGFDASKVKVTGYGRCDLLRDYQSQQDQYRQQYGFHPDEKIILFAPTWKQDDQKRDEIPFGLDAFTFFSALNQFAEKNQLTLIMRFHLNSQQSHSDQFNRIRFLPSNTHPQTEEIVAVADGLVTDWSSIAFDAMVLDKPLIFLNTPSPFKNGFSLPPDYRAGPIVNSLPELENAIIQAIKTLNVAAIQKDSHYQDVKNEVYDDTLDGRSAERGIQRLELLLRM